MKYLLDTNIISEPLKPIPDPAVMQFLADNDGFYAICSPVLHEIHFGIEKLTDSRKKKKYMEYLSYLNQYLEVFPYDSESASIHARERSRLVKQGKTPAFVDGQIASIAIRNRLYLVTKNEKDYKHFSITLILGY